MPHMCMEYNVEIEHVMSFHMTKLIKLARCNKYSDRLSDNPGPART